MRLERLAPLHISVMIPRKAARVKIGEITNEYDHDRQDQSKHPFRLSISHKAHQNRCRSTLKWTLTLMSQLAPSLDPVSSPCRRYSVQFKLWVVPESVTGGTSFVRVLWSMQTLPINCLFGVASIAASVCYLIKHHCMAN
jgi:hypothetical protein